MKEWDFITNHGLVILYISQNPQSKIRDMASYLDVTERTISRVLVDLENEGYITRRKIGRENVYWVDPKHRLKDQLRGLMVGDVLELLARKKEISRNR
jgi:DNA-binding MarR family transcriptional regulator